MPKMICGLILIILIGCVSSAAGVKPSKMVSDFFHLPTSEQVRQFKNYSLDEQYELFIFGNQVVHAPATYLATHLRNKGLLSSHFSRVN